MKLVVIMGITWIADVLSWAHNVAMKSNNIYSTTHDIRYYFWYVMDTINALQGVLIFLVVASQPQVRTDLYTKQNNEKKMFVEIISYKSYTCLYLHRNTFISMLAYYFNFSLIY